MLNKYFPVIVILSILSSSALAGKSERDKAEELKPKVSETSKNVKAACGCEVKLNVNWDSYKKVEDMLRIPNTLTSFETAAKNQCNNAANKQAFCSNVTALELAYNQSGGSLKVEGKTLKCGSSDSGYMNDQAFKQVLDKF